MRQQIILTFLTVAALTCGARTLLVGHRGSNIGVENTAEAFVNGAERNYDFLECDVRVTADGQFVICHDSDTKRLGGSLEVADATLAQLKADSLRQERHGENYSGEICTLGEYLDICRRYSIKPVIELKWSTGINSDDFSNIPALIAAIEAEGFIDNCIIISSMKPCLEYIRSNWPAVELQFLGFRNWRDSFNWCDSLRIDADIDHAYLSAEAVDSLHRAGLKVNCWTVDDLDRARELKDMGVDIITTNAILQGQLPE